MKRPDVIPGFPVPSKGQVELFQQNNKRESVDGIIGPKTRMAIWREPGDGRYTHLAWHPVRTGGAKGSKAWVGRWLAMQRRCDLPLDPDRILTLMGIVSSRWKTGFNYLSTQDGITLGFRRYAAGTLRGFIAKNIGLFRPYLGAHATYLAHTLEDMPNNTGPLAEAGMRHNFVEAVNDSAIWAAQAREFIDHLDRLLNVEHRWARTGREIALLVRVSNSGSGLDNHYVREYGASFDGLARGYIERGGRGPGRVEYIEKLIPHGEKWR